MRDVRSVMIPEKVVFGNFRKFTCSLERSICGLEKYYYGLSQYSGTNRIPGISTVRVIELEIFRFAR